MPSILQEPRCHSRGTPGRLAENRSATRWASSFPVRPLEHGNSFRSETIFDTCGTGGRIALAPSRRRSGNGVAAAVPDRQPAPPAGARPSRRRRGVLLLSFRGRAQRHARVAGDRFQLHRPGRAAARMGVGARQRRRVVAGARGGAALPRQARAAPERSEARLASEQLVLAEPDGLPPLLCRLRDVSSGRGAARGDAVGCGNAGAADSASSCRRREARATSSSPRGACAGRRRARSASSGTARTSPREWRSGGSCTTRVTSGKRRGQPFIRPPVAAWEGGRSLR